MVVCNGGGEGRLALLAVFHERHQYKQSHRLNETVPYPPDYSPLVEILVLYPMFVQNWVVK